MAAKFNFAVHLCAVRLIEKPEAFSCQLLAGVLLDFIRLSIQPCKGDLVSVAFRVLCPFRFGSCILPSLPDTIKRLKYTIICTLIWWIYVFIRGGFPPRFLS